MHRRRAVLALLAACTHALPRDLFIRAAGDDCASLDLNSCPSSLPSIFCCPQKTQCQALAGNTTALCCPSGSACDKIQPIACDPTLQDLKDHPDATVFTTIFDVPLVVCGNGCCPYGYGCTDKQCVRNKDQSKRPSTDDSSKSSTTKSSTPTATLTATSTPASSTTTAAATASQTTTPASATVSPAAGSGGDGGGSKKITTVAAVVGGCGGLLIIAVVTMLCLRRRRKRNAGSPAGPRRPPPPMMHEKSQPGSSCGSSSVRVRGLNISEPILHQDSVGRTDFAALKSPSAASSISQRPINSQWRDAHTHHRGPAPARDLTRRVTPQRRGPSPRIPDPFTTPDPSGHSPRRDSGASWDAHDDDGRAKTGQVGRVAPIRDMRASRHLSHKASQESINIVLADKNEVPPLRLLRVQQQQQQQGEDKYRGGDQYHGKEEYRGGDGYHGKDEYWDKDGYWAKDEYWPRDDMTTLSALAVDAGLADVHRGKGYVPGTTPRL